MLGTALASFMSDAVCCGASIVPVFTVPPLRVFNEDENKLRLVPVGLCKPPADAEEGAENDPLAIAARVDAHLCLTLQVMTSVRVRLVANMTKLPIDYDMVLLSSKLGTA